MNLTFFLNATADYIAQMLPCMLAASLVFFLLRSRRKNRLAAAGLVSGPWRETGLFLFALYCAGLGALTLFQGGFWSRSHWYWVLRGAVPVFDPVDLSLQVMTVQFIPFREIATAFTGTWRAYMLLGNVVMFVPLGFFTALLWRAPRWRRALLIGFCVSLFIEVVQFFIGRSSDIDDVILNTLGALCGFWLFLLFRVLAPRLVKKFQCTRTEVHPHGRETGDRTASA